MQAEGPQKKGLPPMNCKTLQLESKCSCEAEHAGEGLMFTSLSTTHQAQCWTTGMQCREPEPLALQATV